MLGINVPANKRRVGFLFQNYALWLDFETKNAARLAEILKAPAEVVLDECRDKDGNLEEKKAILKLIDAFTLSQYTAKKLYELPSGIRQGRQKQAAARS